jgi:hypothetical protein
VDNFCYKCQAPVPEGKVFCPECRAPLIRVALPEPAVAQVTTQYLDTTPEIVHFSPNAKSTKGIDWAHALPAVTIAGMISAALMMFPFGISGLGMISSGAMAAIVYYRRTQAANVTYGVGVTLGALSGLIGFGIFTVFAAVVTLFAGTQRLHNGLLEAVNQYAAQNNDPQKQQMLEYFRSPAGLVFILIIGFCFLLFMFLAFSIAGGALGTAWVRRRRRP